MKQTIIKVLESLGKTVIAKNEVISSQLRKNLEIVFVVLPKKQITLIKIVIFQNDNRYNKEIKIHSKSGLYSALEIFISNIEKRFN